MFEEETDSSEVVIDDEEVPLASAPKVKTTQSLKDNNEKAEDESGFEEVEDHYKNKDQEIQKDGK